MPDDFLTIDEVAQLTRRTLSAIYSERYRSEGIGVLGVPVGRKLLWRRSDIDRWFAEQLDAQRERVAS